MHAALLVFSHIKWPKGQVPVFKGPLGNFHLEVVFFLIYVFLLPNKLKSEKNKMDYTYDIRKLIGGKVK